MAWCNRAWIIATIRYWETTGDEARMRRDLKLGIETRVQFYEWHKGRWKAQR